MKITVFVYVADWGDGSPSPIYFTTKELRDSYAESFEKEHTGFNAASSEISFDIENGAIVTDEPTDEYSRINPVYVSYEEYEGKEEEI